ncbi:MAG: hypothetical protein ABSD98_10030 [Candidatus Korobacteraceae bacterium]
MTLIAGFRCIDGGILFAADREESSSYSKRSVDKLTRLPFQHSTFVIAGAGLSSILANTVPRLHRVIAIAEAEACGRTERLIEQHPKLITDELRAIHEEYIWGRHGEEDRAIELIVSATFYGPNKVTPIASFLYGTDEEILYPCPSYICSGCGQDTAYYLADHLFRPDFITRQEAMILAAFVFREVRQSVTGVGFGTDMMFISGKTRTYQDIGYDEIAKLDEQLPNVRDTLSQVFGNIPRPDWLSEDI